MSHVSFFKHKSSNFLVETKFHDYVNYTSVIFPETKILNEFHVTEGTHNSVTMKNYFLLIPMLILAFSTTRNKLVHIQYLFYAMIKRIQKIKVSMPNKISVNVIRHGNLPFGRLKMI